MKLPKRPPSYSQLIAQVGHEQLFRLLMKTPQSTEIRTGLERATNEAWDWEDSGYRTPQGLTHQEFWLLIKQARGLHRTPIELASADGVPFSYQLPDSAHEKLHWIDRYLGSPIESSFPQLESDKDRQRFMINSLVEEAISSSQLEGAAVTREQAKDMIQHARKPRNRHEQMIINNYQTIQMLNEIRYEVMTIDRLFDIQRMLTTHTLEVEDGAGRFRRTDESIVVWDDEDRQTLHEPPPADQLQDRMAKMCEFANQSAVPGKRFMHPVVRAIILHFWLAYDHPFVDGNGRTARALFYWSMLRNGYWLSEYISISSVIRKQPKQYARAYLKTEIDDNDLTYFILYHLGVIIKSIEEFQSYLKRKLRQRQQTAELVAAARFNERQRHVLQTCLEKPDRIFTFQSLAEETGVTNITARTDLKELVELGFLKQNKKGRRFEFVAVIGLEHKLQTWLRSKSAE